MPLSSPPTVLSFEDARHVVEEHASRLKPRRRELLSLLHATGRVLAEPIQADRDFPPFPRATRDGYAVRSGDVANVPSVLQVIGEIRAGAKIDPDLQLAVGQAIAIMTGAAVPDGADAVVMIEHTSRDGDRVIIERSVSAGANVVPTGAEGKKGVELLAPGARLDYASIAVIASVGRSRVIVYGKARVAVISTGDEIVDIDVPPGPNQIRNSNTYSLAAQIQAVGGDAVLLPIAPDEPRRLRELMNEGLECDLLLVAGGVSMGKYDLVEQVLAELKAEFFFTGAQIQPGKPIVFGKIPRGAEPALSERPQGESRIGALAREEVSDSAEQKYFFGLPGNPISTMVTFELFVRPVIEALGGAAPRPLLFTSAKLKKPFQTKIGLKRFLPARISGEFERAEVELIPWQGSGDIAAAARANGFVVIPPDRERFEAGEWVPVMLK